MMLNDVWIAGTDNLCYKNSIMENRISSSQLAGRCPRRIEAGEREQEINLTFCAIVCACIKLDFGREWNCYCLA